MQQQDRDVGHIRDLVDLALGGDPEALVIAGDMAKAYDILVAGLRESVYGNAVALATREP